MTETDVAIAAGLITFSGIAATWAAQLTSVPARRWDGVYRMATLAVCALLFAFATILALLFLLGLWPGDALTRSTESALASMVLLFIYLVVVVPVGIWRSIRAYISGTPIGEEIDEQARIVARS